MPLRILIIDPEPGARENLQVLLAPEGHEVVCAATRAGAVSQLAGAPFDVIFCDLQLASESGASSLVRWLARWLPDTPVIAISGSEVEEAAGIARQEGAYDQIAKPFGASQLLHALDRALERRRLACAAALRRRELRLAAGDRPIVAASAAMIELLELIERAAPFRAPALLFGESGTGKEGLARIIHAQSPRRHRPFVAVCCTSGSEEEIENNLFGCPPSRIGDPQSFERGLIFDAEGGTLFVDEVSALPARLQRTLLRAIEEQTVHPRGATKPRAIDVRIVASTCRDLHASVSIGGFSADLLGHLERILFAVPALRDRKQDIPLLADHFFSRARARFGRPLRCVSDEALESLVAYHWPGNIRELENVIERAVFVAEGGQLKRCDLPESIDSPAAGQQSERSSDLGLRRARKCLEAKLIRRALRAAGGNRTHAAKLLEVSHRTLLYKIKEYRSEIE
jgi:two-component system response regulator AtoC